MDKLTDEQKVDIQERQTKAQTLLKELELTPAAQSIAVNLGAIDPKFNSVFATYVQCFLQDTKYSPKPSPLTQEDLAKPVTDGINPPDEPAKEA